MTARKDMIIIYGSAPNCREDIQAALKLIPIQVGMRKGHFMAVGMDALGKFDGPMDYCVTNHPEDIPVIRKQIPPDCKVISYYPGPGIDIDCSYPLPSGSSAITGALAAIRVGYKKIILCGCPLTGNAPEGNPYEAFRPGWTTKQEILLGRVKSMSGWTREFLGEPTKEWLSELEKITIGTIWDGNNNYNFDYVNRLFSACKRNTTIPFDFVLYTGPDAYKPGRIENIDPGIKIVPTGLPYWWSGMKFWQKDPPGIETNTILYLDLDQVIVGSLDDLILFPSDHVSMKDWPADICPSGRENDVCVTTTIIRSNSGAKVWDQYVLEGMPIWDPQGRKKGALPMATQEIVNNPKVGLKKDHYPEDWVCSYRQKVLRQGMPADCRIVAFHGLPKPADVVDKYDWIKENWR